MEAHLDDLGEPVAEVAARQAREEGEVNVDARGLVKRADEVLAVDRVHAGLAADGRVDHGQERRRHLHDRHAAHKRRRHEADDIADDATAERDQARVAPAALLQQPVRGTAKRSQGRTS